MSAPVAAFQLPKIPFWSVNASTSSPTAKLVLMATLALLIGVASGSVATRPGSTAVGALLSVKASAEPVVASVGATLAITLRANSEVSVKMVKVALLRVAVALMNSPDATAVDKFR